jgi:hypothetical protein
MPVTPSVQFASILELETAFRALVLFKFSGSPDAEVFYGSPVMADALSRMLTAIEEGSEQASSPGRARTWREHYVLSNAARHHDTISGHLARHPRWNVMSRKERLDWLAVLAAPYRLDPEGISCFEPLIARGSRGR